MKKLLLLTTSPTCKNTTTYLDRASAIARWVCE